MNQFYLYNCHRRQSRLFPCCMVDLLLLSLCCFCVFFLVDIGYVDYLLLIWNLLTSVDLVLFLNPYFLQILVFYLKALCLFFLRGLPRLIHIFFFLALFLYHLGLLEVQGFLVILISLFLCCLVFFLVFLLIDLYSFFCLRLFCFSLLWYHRISVLTSEISISSLIYFPHILLAL